MKTPETVTLSNLVEAKKLLKKAISKVCIGLGNCEKCTAFEGLDDCIVSCFEALNYEINFRKRKQEKQP